MKVLFYISSLIPLSIMIFFRLWDYKNPFSFLSDLKFYLYFGIPLIAFVLLLIIFNVRGKIDRKSPSKFTKIESQNYNFFIPISTYFIPFITSNFNCLNDWLIALFIIFFIGLIIIKTDLQYLNPLIVILGFHIYKSYSEEKEIFILSKYKLPNECINNFNKITDNLYKLNNLRKKNE